MISFSTSSIKGDTAFTAGQDLFFKKVVMPGGNTAPLLAALMAP